MNREIQKMQRKVDDLPRSIESATRSLRSECDARVQEERRKIAKIEQRCQDDCDKLKDELSGQIRRIQAECDEKISDYEEKLEIAHGNEKHTSSTNYLERGCVGFLNENEKKSSEIAFFLLSFLEI